MQTKIQFAQVQYNYSMLERDKYNDDPIVKYFPNFSLQKFTEHIVPNANSKPFYKLMLNQDQAQRWTSRINYMNNVVLGLFTVALIPIIFFKSIPVLKKFKTKKARFFWSLGLIFFPTNISMYYFTTKNQGQITQSYNINIMQFMRYRMNGDISIMNPSLKWAEF